MFDGYYVVHRRSSNGKTYYAVNRKGMRVTRRFTSYTEADAYAARNNSAAGYDIAEGRAHMQELSEALAHKASHPDE